LHSKDPRNARQEIGTEEAEKVRWFIGTYAAVIEEKEHSQLSQRQSRTQFEIVRGLASPVRARILRLLRRRGPLNVNQISEALGMPQSTIATNIQILEESNLIDTETGRARKGQQKICAARFDEIVIRLDGEETSREKDIIEVEMPLGLYTSYHVSAPCGICSTEGIMGVLDVPDLFLDPCRVQAALIWFGRGYVEYKFSQQCKSRGCLGHGA
jgi:predicted transcriptional regulator